MSRKETQKFFAPPPEAKAALFFLEANYQLNYREGNVERMKFLSPAQIGRAFATKDEFDSGWLEANVIRFALGAKKRQKILSFLPDGRRKVFITDPRAPSECEAGDDGALDAILELEVPLPALLLIGCGQSYYLWATVDNQISRKSKLCAAPFPNLDSSGGICFGKNTAPECRLDTIESVWRLILESPFNNHRSENRCRSHAKDARRLLLALSGKRTFPKNALIKTEHTVGDLWQSVR
ncbi:MAG: prokaryotic E2 ligase family D protein [Acidobacteriota bacterium]|nr:prokaryotic E2 ligase family D protein [Acidobacteriota bacterium]